MYEKQIKFRERVAGHTGHFIGEFANADRLESALARAIANQVIKDIDGVTSSKDDTWLLIPHVTNQIGFDTGISVINPDLTFFGHASKDGACTFFYFGGYTGGVTPAGLEALGSNIPTNIKPRFAPGLSPIVQRSQLLAVGGSLIFTLSSGGNLGVTATPGFQGYLLIRCEFPNARGIALISDVGAQKIAVSCNAEVLTDELTGHRRN